MKALDHVLQGGSYLSDQMQALAVNRFATGGPQTTPAPEAVLSKRELDVFRLLGHGKENREIAQDLGLSIKTVQAFCSKIRDKLQIANNSALLREAVKWMEAASAP
jgi:DNA-binding NarL/FixJ family response regulator